MTNGISIEWMMWRIDDDHRKDPPQTNLIRAIQYYTEKYGGVPNRCEAPPGWWNGLKAPAGMDIAESTIVQPRHLLLTLDPTRGGKENSGLPRGKKRK